MKQQHLRHEKMQDKYVDKSMICPADLCDIFECPEFAESKLRLQVYTQRTDYNYEGRQDHMETQKYRKNDEGKAGTFRYQMAQHYNTARKATLLQKCHRTFLDCIDYADSDF